jgi:protocatechuate 3,4-dioxygenase beta subunit
MGKEKEKGTVVSGVVRQGGRPVESAILQIHPAGGMETEITANMTTSDKLGRYTLSQVEPGEYVILVTLSDQVNVGAYSLNHYEVDVPDTSQFHYDIDVPGGSLSGTVVDKYTLAPLEKVRILILDTDAQNKDNAILELMQGRTAEMYTDGEGRFTISGLAKGVYALRTGGVNPLGLDSGGYARLVISNLHLGEDEQKAGLLIKLEKGGTLEGKVKDAQGMPVPDAVIHLKGPEEPDFEPFSDCTTDASGFFRYDGVPPGKVEVLVKVAGSGEKQAGEVWIEVGQTSTLSVTF